VAAPEEEEGVRRDWRHITNVHARRLHALQIDEVTRERGEGGERRQSVVNVGP
jgi:hypothetical protein